MLLLLAGRALACAGPSTTADVQRNVEAAIYAFVQLDDAGFADYRGRAIRDVTCLGEVIHPPHAASFLRLEGIAAFASGNTSFAVTAFRSAATLEPQHQLQAALAPPGGPLDAVYASARSAPAAFWTLPPVAGVRFVDGIQTDSVPSGLAVVQLLEYDGRVRWSGILTSPADLPPDFATMVALPPPAPVIPEPRLPAPVTPVPMPAPLLPDPIPIPPPLEEPTRARSSAKVPVLIAAAVLGAAAGGLYGGSIVQRGRYQAAPTAKRRASTNNLWIAGVSTAGVALTVGIVGIALPGSKASREPKKSRSVDEGGLY